MNSIIKVSRFIRLGLYFSCQVVLTQKFNGLRHVLLAWRRVVVPGGDGEWHFSQGKKETLKRKEERKKGRKSVHAITFSPLPDDCSMAKVEINFRATERGRERERGKCTK